MSSVLALWRAQWISTGGALRQESRARITLAINLVVDIVAGFWTFNALSGTVAQWQMAGQVVLATHLWLLCLYAWAGISFFAVIGVVSQGFGNDQAILLMSLPLSPAVRLRALYGQLLFTGVGNWIMLANSVTGIAPGTELGWQALSWLLLLNLGVAATVCISLIATLLVIRFVVLHIKRSLAVLAIVGASAGVVFIRCALQNIACI